MKRLSIIILVLLIFSPVFSHKQEMHQHITREAFSLLKMSFPDDFVGLDEMDSFLGYDETIHPDRVNKSIGEGYIVAGSWMEDEYDIVYHYGIFDVPDYSSFPLPSWAEYLIFGDNDNNRLSHTSINHFWTGDNGENSEIIGT
jgi:hypothetical protein